MIAKYRSQEILILTLWKRIGRWLRNYERSNASPICVGEGKRLEMVRESYSKGAPVFIGGVGSQI